MTAVHADQIIEGYLARLEVAMGAAGPAARADLLAEVTSHITEARAGLANETDADVLNILDRLGEPSLLAAELGELPAATAPPEEPETTDGTRAGRLPGSAIAAILVLSVGPLFPGAGVPVVGPLVALIVGLVLARNSGAWVDRDVNLAGIIPVVLVALGFFAATTGRSLAGVESHWMLILYMLGGSVAVMPAGVFLGLRARHSAS